MRNTFYRPTSLGIICCTFLLLTKIKSHIATEKVGNSSLVVDFKDETSVDGRTLSTNDLKLNSTKMASYLQPRGVLGCYLSHRKFWQIVVDRGYDSAIIFEDDVVLIPDFKDTLRTSLTRLKQDNFDYDLVFLGALGMVHPDGRHTLFSKLFSAYIGGAQKYVPINDYLYRPSRPAGTHAYLVTREGAQKLLRLCPKATFHVDLDAFRHHSLRMYMFRPMMAYQTFDSTSLTDLSRRGLFGHIKSTKAFIRLNNLSSDKYTRQTLSHVLEEPLLQLGPIGPVITVERHLLLIVTGTVGAVVSALTGHLRLCQALVTGVLTFVVGVRSAIWLLMHWK